MTFMIKSIFWRDSGWAPSRGPETGLWGAVRDRRVYYYDFYDKVYFLAGFRGVPFRGPETGFWGAYPTVPMAVVEVVVAAAMAVVVMAMVVTVTQRTTSNLRNTHGPLWRWAFLKNLRNGGAPSRR